MTFRLNGRQWIVIFVDRFSEKLIDRTGVRTLATTDPSNNTVYISNVLHGDMLERVTKHELAHCVMISYGLIDDIHRMVYPCYWIEAEEWACNLIADYSKLIWILTSRVIRK